MYHFTGELEDKELRAELEASYDLKLVEVSGKRPNGKSWSEYFLFLKTSVYRTDERHQKLRIPSYSIHRIHLHG